MSDTPRTDSLPRRGAFHHYVVDDILALARQLERELADEKAHRAVLERTIDGWNAEEAEEAR